MGIMTVRDPKDLADLNRRTRNKMSIIKDGQEVSEVILQEGVPTYERVNDAVAEPVEHPTPRASSTTSWELDSARPIGTLAPSTSCQSSSR